MSAELERLATAMKEQDVRVVGGPTSRADLLQELADRLAGALR